jgi:hypothetical protein
MRTFTVKTKGLDSVIKRFEQTNRKLAAQIDDEMDIVARNVAAEARANSKGSIAAQVYADTSQKFRKAVGNSNPIAAYVEFGTGRNVFQGSYSFTSEEKRFARQFYVSGKGTTRSHAAIFPAFRKGIADLTTRIKRVLNIGR